MLISPQTLPKCCRHKFLLSRTLRLNVRRIEPRRLFLFVEIKSEEMGSSCMVRNLGFCSKKLRENSFPMPDFNKILMYGRYNHNGDYVSNTACVCVCVCVFVKERERVCVRVYECVCV